MNKSYALLTLILLSLLTACSIGDSKESLINKANQGDIKSMVALSEEYGFGDTEEGLKYYETWSKNVDGSASSEDILALTKMFYDYKLSFTNGREMYEKLLKLANTPPNKKATLTLLKFYSKYGLKYKTAKLESVFIKTATKQDLLDLYNLYQGLNDYHGDRNRDRIKAIMVEAGYMEDSITDFEHLKDILQSKRLIQDTRLLFSKTLKSNDLAKIYEMGTYLGNRASPEEEIENLIHENTEVFMKKVLTLNPNNEMELMAIFYLSNLYTRHYKNDLAKQKNVLTNADQMDKTERNKVLIVLYDIDRKKYADDMEHFDKLINTSRINAYMNIAKIYHYGTDKEDTNIEQAKIWYKKADTEFARKELAKLEQN